MSVADNDGFLHLWGQVDKLCAVSSHTDKQILIKLGVGLGFAQGFILYSIELNMESAEGEISADECTKIAAATPGLQQLAIEPQIQQRPPAVQVVVDLRAGPHGGKRGCDVASGKRRNSFGQWLPRFASARRGTDDPSGGNVV